MKIKKQDFNIIKSASGHAPIIEDTNFMGFMLMENNSFYNWNLNIRPDSLQMDVAGYFGEGPLAIASMSEGQIRHQAFTTGFFGFHYIRAVNENEPARQKESSQILRELVTACGLSVSFSRALNIPEKQPYSDFWENVLKQISLALGDSLGMETQRMVELGYWLAAAYSCLVELLENSHSGEIAGCLKILEAWMSDLLILAQQTGIPQVLFKSLAESTRLLQRSKSHSTAYKCTQILKLVLKDLLSSETTAGFVE